MKTYTAKPKDIKRKNHVIDASGQTLGRLSSRVACLLMGKHKPIFSHNEDTGDFVVITNADKIRVTGNKMTLKLYQWHTQYPGGFRETTLEKLMEKDSTRVIKHAVKGMLPHNHLNAKMLKKLTVYSGEIPQPRPQETKPKDIKPDEKAKKE